MRAKVLTAALVALLMAAAFFLPERLLSWGDRQLVDSLHMESQDEDREGLAESLQLTVPEKVAMLRGGHMNVMELDQTEVKELIFIAGGGGTALSFREAQTHAPGLEASEDEIARYDETVELWNSRLAAVRGELRSLQTLGGLPEIWSTEGPLTYAEFGDLLYLDPETRVNFQVYQMTLFWQCYNLSVLVDVQSGRILSFALAWTPGELPNWSSRGASGFGGAWRDYWQMDSVSTGWYNEHTRGILENVEALAAVAGDYAAVDQITFLYDGQSLTVPLDCQGSRNRYFFLDWNR